MTAARSCSAICPRISTSPPLATRNSACAAGCGDLADLGVAGEHRALDRGDEARAREARLRLGQLRGDDLDVRRIGHRGRSALLDVLRGEGAGGLDALGALVLGRRQRGLRARLLERGRQAVDLLDEHRVVDLGEDLAALDVVAGLDEHGGDAAGVAFVGDLHVVARGDRAGEGDTRGDRLQRGHDDADQRDRTAVGEGRAGGLMRAEELPGEQRHERDGDEAPSVQIRRRRDPAGAAVTGRALAVRPRGRAGSDRARST